MSSYQGSRLEGDVQTDIAEQCLNYLSFPLSHFQTFSVSNFKRLVQERTGLRPEEQRLQYGGKELVDRQTLGDYNIPNNGTLHLVSRLRGGAWTVAMPPSVMPCGHSVPFTGLYQHCMAAVRSGNDRILCPACSMEWTTKTLRGRSELSESQLQAVDEGLTRNFCLRMPGVITCKGCGSVWSRSSASSSVGGDLCSSCGVRQHDAKKATVELLGACPVKTIDHSQDCPKLRACPKCGNVIEHESQCRRVDCNRCQTTFCFICLTIRSPSCGDYYPCPSHCATAQRQLTIPQQ